MSASGSSNALKDMLQSQEFEFPIDADIAAEVNSSQPASLDGALPKFAKRFTDNSNSYKAELNGDESAQHHHIHPAAAAGLHLNIEPRSVNSSSRASTAPTSAHAQYQYRQHAPEALDADAVPDADAGADGGHGEPSRPGSQYDFISPLPVAGESDEGKQFSREGREFAHRDIYTDSDSAATAAFKKANKKKHKSPVNIAKRAGKKAGKLLVPRPSDPGSGSTRRPSMSLYDIGQLNAKESTSPKVDGRSITQVRVAAPPDLLPTFLSYTHPICVPLSLSLSLCQPTVGSGSAEALPIRVNLWHDDGYTSLHRSAP